MSERTVTVCAACLRTSCWNFISPFEAAWGAGTAEKSVSELRELNKEDSRHYEQRCIDADVLRHALISADEMLDTQEASNWPDSQPISESLDFMTFGELKAITEIARAYWVLFLQAREAAK